MNPQIRSAGPATFIFVNMMLFVAYIGASYTLGRINRYSFSLSLYEDVLIFFPLVHGAILVIIGVVRKLITIAGTDNNRIPKYCLRTIIILGLLYFCAFLLINFTFIRF